MGTDYYKLKSPVTHLKIESQNDVHVRLGIWVNHAKTGTLVLRTEELNDTLFVFFSETVVLHTYWGGKEVGAIVKVLDAHLTDEALVISDYGELMTVAEVKKRDGAKRADGMPTELFGYE